MKLPNAQDAVIASEKIIQYLLDVDHPYGGSKARLLVSLGYSNTQWQQLEADLRSMHLTEDVAEINQTLWGIRFEIGPRSQVRPETRSYSAAFGKLILGRTCLA